MKIKGIIEDVIFRNEENGYTVLNFNANDNSLVAVGIFPFANIGDKFYLTGSYKINAKFGKQFVVENADFIKPNNTESIRRYLSSGLFLGIGPKTAQLIVDKFGTETLQIIENSPKRLLEVRGIGKKKAQDIVESYATNMKVQDTILFLQKYGITTSTALKIYKEYEDKTIETLRNNPYKLVEDIDGIGFLSADRFAQKLGIEKNSTFRLRAALYHVLKEGSNKNGHTYLPQEKIIAYATKLTKIKDEDRYKALLASGREIKKVVIDDVVGYSLGYIYNTENSIAAKLINLRNLSGKQQFNVEEEINHYQKTNNIVLDDYQQEAIKKALVEGVVIITGGPGTGKTTIIKCVTTILDQRGLKVALAAPTGRAAKRMSIATGEEAKTLHRLLGITSRSYDISDISSLEHDVIVVDEISMVDIFIFNALLRAINIGSRLILVGDKDQLPSVACGNILFDMIKSKMFCTVYLNEIYRQAKESMIIVNAHRINNGQMPIQKNSKDFFIDNKSELSVIKESIITMASHRIPMYKDINPMDIQVLAPMRKGIIGVESLNAELQKRINPTGKEIVYRDTIFRQGDKVMQTVNNYSMQWMRYSPYRETGEGVFNGDIGYIIDIQDKEVIVEFEENKQVVYQYSDLEELAIAYCISVHKSQGCEFPVVIIAISSGSHAILTKNLLYTAITRAKDMVVLVGDEKNIAQMINNKYMIRRFSLLHNLLQHNQERLQILKGIN